jgi:hypothetical protein
MEIQLLGSIIGVFASTLGIDKVRSFLLTFVENDDYWELLKKTKQHMDDPKTINDVLKGSIQ